MHKEETSKSALDLLSDLKYLATPTLDEEQFLYRNKKQISKYLEQLKYTEKIGKYVIDKKETNDMTEETKPKKRGRQKRVEEPVPTPLVELKNVQCDNEVMKQFLFTRIDDCKKQIQILEGQIIAYNEMLSNLY